MLLKCSQISTNMMYSYVGQSYTLFIPTDYYVHSGVIKPEQILSNGL